MHTNRSLILNCGDSMCACIIADIVPSILLHQMADTDLHFGNHISPEFVPSLCLPLIVPAFCFLAPSAWRCHGSLLNKLDFLQ